MDIVKSFLSYSSLCKILSSLFCLSFLLYQLSQLLSEYMSGKTVVNIEVKREVYENLPAITLCLPLIVLLEKFVNSNPEHKQDYHNYNQMLNIENIENITKLSRN